MGEENLKQKKTTPEVPVQEQPTKIKKFKFSDLKNKTFASLKKDKVIY